MKRKPLDLNNCRTFTPEQKRVNNWRLRNLVRLGIVTGYDSVYSESLEKLKIEIFGSSFNYELAKIKAMDYIDKGQNVPKELEDKLIRYKEALDKIKNL